MPEGPEVRRYADLLACALEGKPIVTFTARTKVAKAWLAAHPDTLVGRRVTRVRSRGKNMIGWIEGGFFFTTHLMMWGRWEILPTTEPVLPDRRERARIEVDDAVARLLSAPVFEVGEGDPMQLNAHLRALGPDILPYPDEPAFDRDEFLRRLRLPGNRDYTVGAALLDQTILAGVGNYLRAEALFDCGMDPWHPIADLTPDALTCLTDSIVRIARLAYVNNGFVTSKETRDRMREEASLVYRPGSGGGMHYHVFRRTNLPCLTCGDIVRQLRQTTRVDEEGEKTRIIYFCPTCQGTSVALKKPRKPRARAPQAANGDG